ncbi:uncharacterized protein LOC141529193 [Cotesia typhae]|uniref:uncharacterized protein LOC141529193 n=1 Tax=Cotesia typhae TaxID=2053667 RepID=UPI003D69D331
MTEIVDQTDNNVGEYVFTWITYKDDIPRFMYQLFNNESLVDVTLCVAGERIQAHRLILGACSDLFRDVLKEAPEDHPTLIINDVSAETMKAIIEFCYTGNVKVPPAGTRSLFEAARFLQISALMEFQTADPEFKNEDEYQLIDSLDVSNEVVENNWEIENENFEAEGVTYTEEVEQISTVKEEEVKPEKKKSNKTKRKRENAKRDYNPANMEAALNDLSQGLSLVEASTKNNVARSTLYMRCKALGMQLNTSRHDYPAERLKAAINAVMNGASFQSASDRYKIPKTVLWRRIQKENYRSMRPDCKRAYDARKREAAVKALARGENLTKVSLEFQIPKTTLFRDKTKLVDQGKLPESFWKKRKTEDEHIKKMRLEEAVTACLQGKMSQAAASVAYHIPKTTIWRRLQQEQRKMDKNFATKRRVRSIQQADVKVESLKDSELTMCNDSSDIPMTYINENNVEESIIILTKEEVEGLNLDDSQQIIVSTDNDGEYIPCSINIEDTSNYSAIES